jgi:hypothetical protein
MQGIIGYHSAIRGIISYLDSLHVQGQAFLLIGEKFLNILALIALKLNHLSHLCIDDDGAIASLKLLDSSDDILELTRHTELFLDDLEDLLLVEFLRETLDSCQSLTTIALCI